MPVHTYEYKDPDKVDTTGWSFEDWTKSWRAPHLKDLIANPELLHVLLGHLCRSERLESPGGRIRISGRKPGTDPSLQLYTPGTQMRFVARKWTSVAVGGVFLLKDDKALIKSVESMSWTRGSGHPMALNSPHFYPPREVCETCSMRLVCLSKGIG